MRQLSLGRRFQGVLAWNSFFHLTSEDQRKMFAVFSTHVVEGGILMFTSGPEAEERIGSFKGEPLYHASLSADEYRSLLDKHGFDVLSYVAEDKDCAGQTVWLAKSR